MSVFYELNLKKPYKDYKPNKLKLTLNKKNEF